MRLTESVKPYLAARAVFLLVQQGHFSSGPHQGRSIRDVVRTIALPGLGTGVGRLGPNICAHQVRAAIDAVVPGKPTPARSWVESSERHQLLYTDRPRRLQE